MADNSFEVSLGISDVIKEVKDTETVKEADKTTALLVRAIHAALSPLEKWVMQKEYNLAETKKLLEAKLKDTSVEKIITPPPYVAVPAIQSISYCMDDPILREMYAELLAHAMNSDTVDNVHPTYVEIIKQMSPYDAVVFKELCEQVLVPCIDVSYTNKKTKASYPINEYVMFTDLSKHPLVPTQISLENLERLRLIEAFKNSTYANNQRYEQLKSAIQSEVDQFIETNKGFLLKEDYEVTYREYIFQIRAFGQFFARACMGVDFSNIE